MRIIADRLAGWTAALHPREVRYGWLAVTLAVGLAGAGLFLLARLPLPWMLGPMVVAMIVALAGLPVTMPHSVRAPMLSVLGVMVGASATPELLSRIPEWLLPLGGLVVVMVLGATASYFYFRRAAGYDHATAYFASVPGGLTEMILLSEARGGDARLVALSHAVRVTFVVLAVPFFVEFMSGAQMGTRAPAGIPLLEQPPGDLAWFVGVWLVGALLAGFVRSATGLFLFPLLVSAVLHGLGITNFAIPREAGLLAQLFIGLSLGCRFYGMHVRTIGASVLWAIGAGLILIGTSFGFAIGMAHMTGADILALFLAYAPAGVAEMSLVAIALHIEVAFVVLHHLSRLLLVTLVARAIFDRIPPAAS